MVAPRTRMHRCMYFQSKFCASGECPTPPPCTLPNWSGPMDCATQVANTRSYTWCRQDDCPCWSGYTPPLPIRVAYSRWSERFSKTHIYDEGEDLNGGD